MSAPISRSSSPVELINGFSAGPSVEVKIKKSTQMGADSLLRTDGLHTVILTDNFASLPSEEKCTHRGCCIIPIAEGETPAKIQELVNAGFIGVLHIKDHKIQSLTIKRDMFDIFNDLFVDELFLQTSKGVFAVENAVKFRHFKDNQYQLYALKHFPGVKV